MRFVFVSDISPTKTSTACFLALLLTVFCGCQENASQRAARDPSKPTAVSSPGQLPSATQSRGPAKEGSANARHLFLSHNRQNTLFQSATAQEFLQKGWGDDYARLILAEWQGQSHEGIALALRGLPNHTYRVGQPFDCEAILTNTSDKTMRLNTGGSCGMAHPLGLLVIPPGGGLGMGWCRGLVGGPHCFCRPTYNEVGPGGSVKAMTGFASAAAVVWKPDKPGTYVVVGTYILRSGERHRSVYSAPLAIAVE
jgi:hypothetical protein